LQKDTFQSDNAPRAQTAQGFFERSQAGEQNPFGAIHVTFGNSGGACDGGAVLSEGILPQKLCYSYGMEDCRRRTIILPIDDGVLVASENFRDVLLAQSKIKPPLAEGVTDG